MPGLDGEFEQTLERVTGLLAQRDDPDALATLEELAETPDKPQWLSQHRETIVAAQASSGEDVSPLSLAPMTTDIDDLLAPLIVRRVSHRGH